VTSGAPVKKPSVTIGSTTGMVAGARALASEVVGGGGGGGQGASGSSDKVRGRPRHILLNCYSHFCTRGGIYWTSGVDNKSSDLYKLKVKICDEECHFLTLGEPDQ
jgi:hypothetical protein